ncbi:MAG: EmrA/EmrK family multidrug efflux transporter periplasmic adaptor subunit [Haemophilus parainfluenzae]|jgi:multidrug resistance protein A homolog|uniref:Multidrug resistance protein A n=1 Tax=Haemophilus parainfluenzae HK2019 TaxID=1095746 RepID=A0ABN0EVU7_HAEPA|nr:EmrA/EmrK family multidrug efflux transporter periplasmic adaptor subunit [Haemophilus parainfluenzae]EIJ30956.1 putative multidrug resistance protein A [Haemophilus parainfluenzae HK2019]MBS5085391.1 EmrA/EmrK family multidrug efflux transporter periplasmic adaptor subunit [Haemophilus parainfluenzae]MBS6190296.1 EmrA/EmrK family multidrug efflux transporter periplasmic adaptor subunit [Haemophilus parainfluenzae]MDU1101799.1 EmrA/EmrK family multidrug efflux transporter periplasmic adaptor
MSDQQTDTQTSSNNKSQQRKKGLSIFILLLLLIAIGSAAYWFFFIKGFEETEDAYVSGNQVMVSAQVAGNISKINVDNMDPVQAGDVLLELDDTNTKLSFEQAKSNLANAVRQISQLNYTVKQLKSAVRANEITLAQAQGNLNRRVQLVKDGAIDKESFQHAKEAVELAKANLTTSQNQLEANQALLLDGPLSEQPQIQSAVSNLKQAWLNLERTKIRSPIKGYVARRNAQVGQAVSVGGALMAVVTTDQMWLDANFKETQLTHMRIGQSAEIHFDLYGKDKTFNGKVVGIEMGTGSAFSLLPTQNATGNWIKVVQRVPVRIQLDPQQLAENPLRIGLSATVKVNVTDSQGETLRNQARTTTLYSTNALQYDESAVNNLIESIIRDNSY